VCRSSEELAAHPGKRSSDDKVNQFIFVFAQFYTPNREISVSVCAKLTISKSIGEDTSQVADSACAKLAFFACHKEII